MVLFYRFSAIKTGNLFLSQQHEKQYKKYVQKHALRWQGLDRRLRPTVGKFTQHADAVIIIKVRFVRT